jgi:hypothetical protein
MGGIFNIAADAIKRWIIFQGKKNPPPEAGGG